MLHLGLSTGQRQLICLMKSFRNIILLLLSLLLVFGWQLPLPSHEDKVASENPYFALLQHEVDKYKDKFTGVNDVVELLSAQMFCESTYQTELVSYAGAIGLMQIMPATAKWLGFEPEQMFYPELNVKAGVKMDKWCYDRWANMKGYMRWTFTFATYHDGLGNVKKHCQQHLPCKFTYCGTQYYFRIFQKYRRRQ